MQGLFKLGIVGSREQMAEFIEKSQENELLKDWVISDEQEETGGGLRRVEGTGVKKFLDKYKLVIENTGSGNIQGIEELAGEVSSISDELEVVLLIQYLDTCSMTDWFVYYCPPGSVEDIAEGVMISKGEEGMSWWEIKDSVSYGMDLDIDVDEVWNYYEKNKNYFNEESKLTKEIIKCYIDEIAGSVEYEDLDGYDGKQEACEYLLREFYNEKSENVEYFYTIANDSLPSLAYISRLFEEEFVECYRFIPENFDNRFEGKIFVVSGEPDCYGSEKTKELISKFGGVVRGSVSGKTNYLIVGDYAGGSKIVKAKTLGTPIIDVDDFEKMISEKFPLKEEMKISSGPTPMTSEVFAEEEGDREEENHEEKSEYEGERKENDIKEAKHCNIEQIDEQDDEKRVEKEKRELKEQCSEINLKLQAANEEKKRLMNEVNDFDEQVALKSKELKALPFWKGTQKQEIKAKIEELNVKKSDLLNEVEKVDCNINLLNNEIDDINKKLPLIMTKKEKEQREKEKIKKLLKDSTPCYTPSDVFAHGRSEAISVIADNIASILTLTPKTVSEINDELGTEYTAIQIAKATKYIKGAYSKKVIREIIDSKGQKQEKEYTAYFIYYDA